MEIFQPAIITGSAALLGAVLAQILSHWFTIRRENNKYYREVYQNLLSPILLDIYYYFEIATHFRKGHDTKDGINEDILIQNVINHIQKNIKYANPKLISAFERYKGFGYFEDLSGLFQESSKLDLIIAILDQAILLSRKVDLFEKEQRNKLLKIIISLDILR